MKELILFLIIAIPVLLVFFTPTFVAAKRDHKNFGPIAVVNFFLGGTLIGWAVALAWSLSDNVEPKKETEEAAAAPRIDESPEVESDKGFLIFACLGLVVASVCSLAFKMGWM